MKQKTPNETQNEKKLYIFVLDFQLRSFVDPKPVELLESQPLVWGMVYCASNFTDFSNFISAIKQGGLEKTLDVQL